MNIVVSTDEPELETSLADSFSRSSYFMFNNTDTNETRFLKNPFTATVGGAGIQSALLLIENGADILIVKEIGINALRILELSGITVYCSSELTAISALKKIMLTDKKNI